MDEFIAFLSQPSFKRFIACFLKTYRRLGHLGGMLILTDLTEDEKESIGGLLGMDLSDGTLRISYAKIKKQLQLTKYADYDLELVLETMVGYPLYSNKQMKAQKQQDYASFQEDFPKVEWLMHFFNDDPRAKRLFFENKKELSKIIHNVLKAINALPNHYEMLPVFSQRITKDSHYFDTGLAYDLLIRALDGKGDEALYQAKILKDDVSNFCMICHLRLIQPSNFDGFYRSCEPWNMNLYNLNQAQGDFLQTKVFIFENPAVFRTLCRLHLPIALVCSFGQINTTTYLLLDRLSNSGCELYYAGDFDPEGLSIASKLKERYPTLQLMLYHQAAFDKIKVKIELSAKRMTLLNNIQCQALEEIKTCIKNTKMCGYQEGLLDDYEKLIRDLCKS